MTSWIRSSSESIIDENADLIWTDSEDSFKSLRETLLRNGIDKADVEQVFSECLRGLTESFLSILDGGTALAEKGRVYLVDEDGKQLGEGLRDEFLVFLLKTDRLK